MPRCRHRLASPSHYVGPHRTAPPSSPQHAPPVPHAPPVLHAHRAHRTRRTRRAPQAEKDAAAAEEEYLRDALAAILQTEVEELRLGLQKRADEAANAALEIEDGTVREVSVIFETEEARPPRHAAPATPPPPRVRAMRTHRA